MRLPDDTNAAMEGKSDSKAFGWTHAVLFYAALFGLGIICGYGLFLTVFIHRSEAFLDQIEMRHNDTISSLNYLYQQAVSDYNDCNADDTRSQEIFDLKGRLEAQSALVTSHRSLLYRHQISKSRLEEIEAQLARKHEDLFQVQKRVDLLSREKNELEQDLQDLKQNVRKELEEKSDTIESLESSIEALQRTERDVMEHVSSRHASLCRLFFGRGPYYVKFQMNLPKDGESFFVVEIATRKILPLSVFTLLTLVESGFYDELDLTIGGHGSGLLQIRGQQSLDDGMAERLRSLGFQVGTTFYFDEKSEDHPCHEGNVSFDDRGPGLLLYTTDHGLHYGSCFGLIVRGKDDVLPLIESSLREGASIKVLSASILLDEGDSEEL